MLFERFPEWAKYAGSYGKTDGDLIDRNLVVTVPNAHPALDEPLVIVVYPRARGSMWLFVLWGERWLDELLPWPHLSQEELFKEWISVIEHRLSSAEFPRDNQLPKALSLPLNPAQWKGCVP